MIRKYLVVMAGTLALALVAAVLGLLFTVLRTTMSAPAADSEAGWQLAALQRRSDEQVRMAAQAFKQRYRWLPAEDPVEVDTAAAAPVNTAPVVPTGPQWLFVGVVAEEHGTDHVALVAEAGRVNKYKVGDAFVDGTTLLAIEAQSLTVSQAGEERDVFLYRRN